MKLNILMVEKKEKKEKKLITHVTQKYNKNS